MKHTVKSLFSLLLTAALLLTPCAVLADGPDGPQAADLIGKTVILHSNDVHGAVEGYAVIAALKADYEARGAEVILADAGDFSQGTAYVSTSRGASAVELMNLVGYDVAAVGNHEFDYGREPLLQNAALADFPLLCANLTDENGAALFASHFVYTAANGMTVGFFAVDTPESKTKVNPSLVSGLDFAAGDALYACAAAQTAALADADIVICLSHLGMDAASGVNTAAALYAQVPGIDFIIDAHSHTVMTEGPAGEPIQSTGTAFANVGMIVIDNASATIESNCLIPVTPELPRDAAVDAAAQSLIAEIQARYSQIFARSEVELNGDKAPNGNRDSETNAGDLVADAMRWSVLRDSHSVTVPDDHVLALTNGGGIRAWIHAGDVTRNDINTVLPFGNTLTVVYVTGAQLLEALEASTYCLPDPAGGFPQVSGISYTVDTGKAYDARSDAYPGSTYYGPDSICRVTVDSVNGKPFAPEDTYAVITNDFISSGGDTYAVFAASPQYDTGLPLDEVLIAYTDEVLGGVIGAQYAAPAGRIRVLAAAPETAAPASASEGDAVYVVMPGDSLWTIALRLYGSGSLWTALFETNRDTVRDADLIYAGQRLKLP